MVVLDTCALLWWTLEPQSLSEAARNACDRIPLEGGLISSISLWEVALKMKRGQLSLGLSRSEYVSRLARLRGFTVRPVDTTTWMASVDLDWEHRDPADRVIVATAKLLGAPLVTRDERIAAYYADTVW